MKIKKKSIKSIKKVYKKYILYKYMPLYVCKACQYETKIKTHYTRHLKTKKHITKCEKGIIIEPKTYPKEETIYKEEINDKIKTR